MGNNCYGYIRVSSKDQNGDRQRIAMCEARIDEKNIYMDKLNIEGRELIWMGKKKAHSIQRTKSS